MTTPVVTAQTPSNNKAWLVTAATVVGFIISGLTWVAPVLPEKFSAVALLVLGILTPIGAYLAKYKEPDEVIVKKSEVVVAEPKTGTVSVPYDAAQQTSQASLPRLPLPPTGDFTSRTYDSPYQ